MKKIFVCLLVVSQFQLLTAQCVGISTTNTVPVSPRATNQPVISPYSYIASDEILGFLSTVGGVMNDIDYSFLLYS